MASKRIYCLVVFFCCSTVDALTCYQCVDVSTSSSFISTVGHTDPNCETPSFSTATTTCQTGEVCGYVKGKVDVSLDLFVTTIEATINLHTRDCMSVVSGTSMKCYKNQYYTDVINKALSFIADLVDVEFDGDVCFCKARSLCKPPDYTPSPSYGSLSWVWLAIGGGAAGFIILMICLCCCCYFCCCKERPAPQPVIIHSGASVAPVGMVTYANPGYAHGGIILSHHGPTQNPGPLPSNVPEETHGPRETNRPIQTHGSMQTQNINQ
ncbi:unnamed protein product [Owenia fusiformis]|uniref:Uncharacterized protein n=1 Tax=Owenia fusiformis TaxID=6347 RepID=A0A8J1UKE7_OWEFU|nr:unnamed protein product [Owenia fusiformis]